MLGEIDANERPLIPVDELMPIGIVSDDEDDDDPDFHEDESESGQIDEFVDRPVQDIADDAEDEEMETSMVDFATKNEYDDEVNSQERGYVENMSVEGDEYNVGNQSDDDGAQYGAIEERLKPSLNKT